MGFRAAINVLRDSVESGRMPSGLPLVSDAAELHADAAECLEILLRRSRPGPRL